jgi:hypothetical protein
MILSIILMVLAILIILGTLFASLGTVSLGFASQDANKERAFQAADAGLVNATTNALANGQLPPDHSLTYQPQQQSFSIQQAIGPNLVGQFMLPNSPQHDYAVVSSYVASGFSGPLDVGVAHIVIPSNSVYVISEGFACTNGSPLCSAKVGALFSQVASDASAYAVQAGAISMVNPTNPYYTYTLQGWNSATDPLPTSEAPNAAILATNSTTAGAVNLNGGTVSGQIMVPHSASSAVVSGGTGRTIGYLTGPMDFGSVAAAPSPLPTGPDFTATPTNLPANGAVYNTLTVHGACVFPAGTYQANSLVITDAYSSLGVSTGSDPVVLTVEKSMNLPTTGVSFVNSHNPSNCLNITYLGTDDAAVTLNAGSPVAITAPHATLKVTSLGTTVAGAWFAQALNFNLTQNYTSVFCDLNYGYRPASNNNNNNNNQNSFNQTQTPVHYQFLSKQRL